MVETNHGAIPDDYLINYLKFLTGRVFKLLPMQEEKDDNLKKYMNSLQRELLGNKELIIELRDDNEFLVLLGKLEYLINNDVSDEIYRKDILDCVNLIGKIKERYERGE